MLSKKTPIGVDSFFTLVHPDNNYLFADKTEMIAKLIDNGSISILITRPRRWGKTLNFSMLEHFFASEVNGRPTKDLFKGLKIESLNNGDYMKHQGQYGVISFTLKGIKPNSIEQAHMAFRKLLCKLFDAHYYLLESRHLLPNDLLTIERFSAGEPTLEDMMTSLDVLSRSLYRHTGQQVYIFIDEYDTPVMHAFECDQSGKTEGFLDDLVNFMKSFFTAGLKGNDYLKKGVMSGILRVSYHEMLSDLNNLKNYGVLNDATFSACYGFTDEEVKDFFQRSGRFASKQALTSALGLAKQYYNGYEINSITLYNPWSIINFLKKNEAMPYWINTGSDTLIKRHAMQGGEVIQQKFADLIQGRPVREAISEYIRFDQLGAGYDGIWTVLLYSGYLKARNAKNVRTMTDCDLYIPNQEVQNLYEDIFVGWFREVYSSPVRNTLLKQLVEGNVPAFINALSDYLYATVSVRDFTEESHYHAFILGLVCSMTETHIMESNKEAGHGYVDVMLVPRDEAHSLGVILEFKHVRTKHIRSQKELTPEEKQDALVKAAQAAIDQAVLRNYEATLKRYPHITKVMRVGMSFCGKLVAGMYQQVDLTTGEAQELQFCFPEE